jgi:hypothetical protein
MTTNGDQGTLRDSVLFLAIEQAAAPTVKLDNMTPETDEADQAAESGEMKGPTLRGPEATTIVGN